MSTRSTDEGDASLATEEVLERLVQRFEKQWSDSQRGRLPKIEDFLPLVTADQRGECRNIQDVSEGTCVAESRNNHPIQKGRCHCD